MTDKKETLGKYQIIKKLEETNYAIIYLVKGPEGKLLVLKIARKNDTEYNALISREYEILSQFKHPNIVSVFDFSITKDKRPYFTLEYVLGKPINKHFKGFSEEFISAIIQLINGLGAFHNKGFIHGDLKPENILYNPDDKRVILIDFGFAGIPTHSTILAGTIGYMAPEVIKGIGIDQQSDLYSLGVIIYEILSCKTFKSGYSPIKNIPEDINIIHKRLVSNEPAVRPTIPELFHVLSKYSKPAHIEEPQYKVTLPNMGFIEIPEVVESLVSGKGKVIIVNGNTGAGKTRLLQEMKFRYLMNGYSVLYFISREKTKFYESMQHFTGSKIIDLSEKEDKFQIYEEIISKLKDFATNNHVVIMVDDLEYLSEYDLSLFRYIGYGLKGTNILLIGTSKFSERVNRLRFQTLSLRPFSSVEIKELLEKTFFEIEPIKHIQTSYLADFSEWLHKQSGGNPLFIEEILQTLYENKIIFYKVNRWKIEMNLLSQTTIPSKIEDLLERRLQGLGSREIEILQVLSLAYHPLETMIINLIYKSHNDIEIEHLKNIGLLHEEIKNNRRIVYISNQILIQLIVKRLNKKEKELLSRALIKTIETTAQKDKTYLPILANLCNGIGDNDKAYKYLQSSAKNSELIFDHNAALNYYKAMLNYEKEYLQKKYPITLIKIADINQLKGDNETALEYYNTALKCRRKDINTVIYTGMGRVYSEMRDYTNAVKFLRKAMELPKNKESQDYIKIAVYSLIYLDQSEDINVILNQLFLSKKKFSDTEILAETMYYQALYEWLKGNIKQGIKKSKENLQFTKENNLMIQYAYIEHLLSFLYQKKGDVNQAQKYLKDTIKRFKEMKLINPLLTSLSNLGYLYGCQGNYSKANEIFKNSFVIAQQTNNTSVEYSSSINIGNISERLGRLDEAIDYYEKAQTINFYAPMSHYKLAIVLSKKGEIEKAESILKQKLKKKEELLYFFAMAIIYQTKGKIIEGNTFLNKGLELIDSRKLRSVTSSKLLLRAAQFYYENEEYDKSLQYSIKVKELVHPLSREYSIAHAFIKIIKHNLRETNILDITQEKDRLKEIGCIFDYTYLKKLEIKSLILRGIKPDEIGHIAEELQTIKEIFSSFEAEIERKRVETIQINLLPSITKHFVKSVISYEYVKTFSRLAELINVHLGDEDFIQNILDLIIQTTKAERGALFLKTARGMKLCVGRDIDKTTIKDARELSRTVIKQIEKNKIIFTQDALSDPNFQIKKSVMLNKIRSLLCIPLVVSENIIGALYLDSRIAGGLFGLQDKDFLLTVSRILASVIEKSMVFHTLAEENILLKSKMIEEIGTGYIIGKSAPMKKVYQLIDSVGQTNSPVLILGETGTGKGMLARLIHLKSKRKNNKFHTINCGTIPETLLESELFGHKKGSFTGAINDKKGLLEEAQGGTVFLDEITNTSPSFQAKLLEAVEEKIIRRVGETQTRKIDVRFLFATNKDLEIEVEEDRFRKDLFYRINVFSIEVPTLRERVSDIPVLANFFSNRCAKEINKTIKGFTPEAMQSLKEYLWQGNVRELQNVIERAVIITKGQLITTRDLGFEKIKDSETISLKEIKKEAIIEALNATGWSIK
ncbi:sigma 54-interacting transcriptional regulator, partial [candidate division WOR-3 bacterium]|nr:sigma 54-interacting transcriptional regulator [candidate division WOR-3 bacterium]